MRIQISFILCMYILYHLICMYTHNIILIHLLLFVFVNLNIRDFNRRLLGNYYSTTVYDAVIIYTRPSYNIQRVL